MLNVYCDSERYAGNKRGCLEFMTGKDVFETTAKSIKDKYDVKLCVKEG